MGRDESLEVKDDLQKQLRSKCELNTYFKPKKTHVSVALKKGDTLCLLGAATLIIFYSTVKMCCNGAVDELQNFLSSSFLQKVHPANEVGNSYTAAREE